MHRLLRGERGELAHPLQLDGADFAMTIFRNDQFGGVFLLAYGTVRKACGGYARVSKNVF